jgi:nucleoside-diphosphate-sugar epimerase
MENKLEFTNFEPGVKPEILSKLRSFYSGKHIIVTGGASFIGSHLVDRLIDLEAKVLVLDDLSSGKVVNLQNHENLEFRKVDLSERENAEKHIKDASVVFHLAAIHGGRGFIETFQKLMLTNLTIDNNVFNAALKSGTSMIVHASSACAYPIKTQSSTSDLFFLSESQSTIGEENDSNADGVYGWTKLMGEYQLKVLSDEKMHGRSARIFTAYGERENESHAAIALIAKSLLKMDPFPIWSTGEQTRNFTHVSDTVFGLLLLGSDQRDVNFDVCNIGTSSHIKVIDFIEEIFKQLSWRPENIERQLDKPMGVASRASDNSKISALYGWEPTKSIEIGISKTLNWYQTLEDRPMDIQSLNDRLISR